MNVSKYIINFFKSKKINNFYVFQGGAIMNIINEIGKDKSIKYLVPHHEQSLSMQVDSSARLNGYSVGMVTSGPGATNILTGVCSAYYDSVPCFFITGQVGQVHLKKNEKYRQLGFQETDVVSIFKSVTKYCRQIKNEKEIPYELEKAYNISISGRPGPVLLDIPFNIQKMQIKKTKPFLAKINKYKNFNFSYEKNEINKLLKETSKPMFIIGGGIKNSRHKEKIMKLLTSCQIPFALTWTSFDIVDQKNKYYLGCIGKNGHRSANIACEETDIIITLGQRFAIKNIFGNFGKKAKIISIDIDEQEIKPNFVKITRGINLSIDIFYEKILRDINFSKNLEWIKQTSDLKKKLFNINVVSNKSIKENLVNPFIFINKISNIISKNYIIHCDIGAHQTWFFQSFHQKEGQKIINHCGHGAMGHSVCSAISSNFLYKNKKNIAFIGDGGFMMNLQELNLIDPNNKNIKIIVLNNSSLGNTFLGTLNTFKQTYGNEKKNGYNPPDVRSISKGFKLNYLKIEKNSEIQSVFKKFIQLKKSVILDVKISKYQPTAELHQIKSKKNLIQIEF